MTFIPSDEQQAIFDYVEAHIHDDGRKALALSALAGTGKTTTILELIKLLASKGHEIKGVYCAFNRDIVTEVKPKLEDTKIQPKTFHQLAMGSLIKHLKSKFKTQIPKDCVDVNKYRDLVNTYIDQHPELTVMFEDAAGFEDDTSPDDVRKKFINNTLQLCHFLRVRLEEWDDKARLDWIITDYGLDDPLLTPDLLDVMVEMQPTILSQSEEILKKTGIMDFDDMIYWICRWDVRLWQNKWVFVDEAQDLSPMQRMIVSKVLDHKNGFIIIVGDHHQCVVEGTIIGDTPVEEIQIGDVVPSGIGRGRIENNRVTNVFNRYVENHPVITIKTRNGKELTTTPEHIHFAEFMHDEDREKYFTYLMYKNGYGYRVGVTRSYRSASSHTLGYKVRSNQESADATWLLKISDTEPEARFYENLYAAKFGLPTITFKHVSSSPSSAGMSLSQDMIDTLFAELDTEASAKRLLNDLDIDIEYPHHMPKCTVQERRRNATVTLCSDPRGPSVLHKIEISGNDPDDRKILEGAGIRVTDNGKGTGWRLRKTSKSLKVIHDMLYQVRQVMDVNVVQNANLSKGRSLAFMPASNIMPGMSVFIDDEGKLVKDRVVSVEESTYTGYVYDLNVEYAHNFIANGIATHNSIYRFTGADSDSFERTVKWFKADVLPITVTRRCDKIIAHHAAQIVEGFTPLEDKSRGKLVWIPEEKFADYAEVGDMVICRVKAPLIGKAIELIAKEIPAIILGGNIGTALIDLMETISKRDGFQWSKAQDAVESYQYVRVQYFLNKEDEAAADNIRDDCEAIKVLLENSQATSLTIFSDYVTQLFSDTDEEGKVVLCTGHKSKGLEANRVWILKPDKLPLVYTNIHPEALQQEKNLEYVIQTRAKNELVYLTNKDFMERYEAGKEIPSYVQYDFEDHKWTDDGLFMLDDDGNTVKQLPSGSTKLVKHEEPEKQLVVVGAEENVFEVKTTDDNPHTISKEDIVLVDSEEDGPVIEVTSIEKAIEEKPLSAQEAADVGFAPSADEPFVEVKVTGDDNTDEDGSAPIPAKDDELSLAEQYEKQVIDPFYDELKDEDDQPTPLEFPSEPVAWAKYVFENKDRIIILDTETTTWATDAENCEVIQLAIIDLDGNALFNQRIKPHQAKVSEGAAKVHGITDEMLENEKNIENYLPFIRDAIECKTIIAYNAAFDEPALGHAFRHANIKPIEVAGWECAMLKYASHNPNKTHYGRPGGWWKLVQAMKQQRLSPREDAHDALADVLMTLDLIKSMAQDDDNRWRNKYGFMPDDVVKVKASGTHLEVIKTLDSGEVNMKDPKDNSRITMRATAIELVTPASERPTEDGGSAEAPTSKDEISEATETDAAPTDSNGASDEAAEVAKSDLVAEKEIKFEAGQTVYTRTGRKGTVVKHPDRYVRVDDGYRVTSHKPETLSLEPPRQSVTVTPVPEPEDRNQYEELEKLLAQFGSRESAENALQLLHALLDEVFPA